VTATPHDALFKAAFSQVVYAAEELRHVLPPKLVARMDFSTLAVEAGSFVDEQLRELHTDLLYSLRIDGRDARIYILFEHQSNPDRWMPLRLLRYMLGIWEGCIADGAAILPVIIPVVLHHSDSGWTATTRFEALFDLPDGTAEFTPHFRFALDDLGAQSEQALQDRAVSAFTRLVLSALQQARGWRDVRELLLGWIDLIHGVLREPDGGGAMALIMRYLFEVRGAAEFATIDTTVREITAANGEVMETIAQMLESRGMERGLQQGLREGRQEGRQEGIAQGERELLLRLLRLRFGELPAAVRERVAAAQTPELDRWAEQLLAAASLDEVFGVP